MFVKRADLVTAESSYLIRLLSRKLYEPTFARKRGGNMTTQERTMKQLIEALKKFPPGATTLLRDGATRRDNFSSVTRISSVHRECGHEPPEVSGIIPLLNVEG